MTADEWEPSEKMAAELERNGWIFDRRILIAVRPLLIAEARPQIEAEEFERTKEKAAKLVEYWSPLSEAADAIRALKDSKP